MKYKSLRAALRHANKALKGPWHLAPMKNRTLGTTRIVKSAATGINVGQINIESADFIAACGNARDDMHDILIEVEHLEHQLDLVRNDDLRRAYAERNMLIALLTKLYASWLELHPDTDESWDKEWRTIVFMHIEDERGIVKQASWHIHDSEVHLFQHLEMRAGNSWDGHTTQDKYAWIEKVIGKWVKHA